MRYNITDRLTGIEHSIEARSEAHAMEILLWMHRIERVMNNKPYLSKPAAIQELHDNSDDLDMCEWLRGQGAEF